ncbi:hypothetical protein A5641_19325 [Mycobacterium sp. 1554424.7]|nr:hypothetical protein A5641_19325 [Mycobacterium sp. 1554424.7]
MDQLHCSFPAAARPVDEIRRQHRSARLATAHAIALLLGWQLFGPVVRAATGLDDFPQDNGNDTP